MTVDFDNVLLEIGDFGLYQKFAVYLLCIPACFLNVFNNLGLVFQAYTPSFRCHREYHNNYTNDEYNDECTTSQSSSGNLSLDIFLNSSSLRTCQNFDYDKEHFESTIITDFNLICDRSINYKIALSLFNALSIVGCFLYSYVQDRWGRKKAFMISLTAYLFGSLASLFANNLLMFTILRIPSALGASATWSISYIWGLEYVGASKRDFVTFLMSILYGTAAIVLGLTAWLCRTWFQLGMVTTCPFFLLYSFYFLIEESPRWLLSRGRVEEAEVIVRKMARWQKVSLKEGALDCLRDSNLDEHLVRDDAVGQIGSGVDVKKLFCGKNMLGKTLLITCIWFSIGITDNTLDYNVENLGGNFYVAYVFQAAVQIPASFLALLLLSKFGRVLPLSFSLILFCGLFSLLTVPAEMINIWTVMVCAAAAKLGAYLANTIIYQFGGELYPTVLRGCGIGFSSAVADVGTICMPYVIHSSETYRLLPMLVIGTFSLFSGLGCLFLPETANQCLPETVEEAERQGAVSLNSLKSNLKRFFKIKLILKSDDDPVA